MNIINLITFMQEWVEADFKGTYSHCENKWDQINKLNYMTISYAGHLQDVNIINERYSKEK